MNINRRAHIPTGGLTVTLGDIQGSVIKPEFIMRQRKEG